MKIWIKIWWKYGIFGMCCIVVIVKIWIYDIFGMCCIAVIVKVWIYDIFGMCCITCVCCIRDVIWQTYIVRGAYTKTKIGMFKVKDFFEYFFERY